MSLYYLYVSSRDAFISICWSVGLFASFSLNSRSILRGCEMCAATHCNALQHTATHCISVNTRLFSHKETYICSTLQHTATHCNMLQHNAHKEFGFVICVNKRSIQSKDIYICSTLQHTATRCNTLQHTATYYNTLRHNAIPSVKRDLHRCQETNEL